MNNDNKKTLVNYQETTTPAVPIQITLDNKGVSAAPSGSKAPAATSAAAKKSKITAGLPYAIAGFVMGLLSLVAIIVLGFFALPLSVLGPIAMLPYGIGMVTSIVGIILSALGKKKGDTTGLGTAGLIMSIIPLALIAAIIALFFVGCAGCVGLMGMLSSGM